MRGDVLFLDEEEIPEEHSIRAYHPLFAHVFKTYPKRFKVRELLEPIFQKGELVYKSPSVKAIRENALKNLKQLDAAYKRFRNPHTYHISLSPSLFKIKQRLLREAAKRK